MSMKRDSYGVNRGRNHENQEKQIKQSIKRNYVNNDNGRLLTIIAAMAAFRTMRRSQHLLNVLGDRTEASI